MTYSLERLEPNPHTNAHRNGNSSTFVSYIIPKRWKEVVIMDVSFEEAKELFQRYRQSKNFKYRLVERDASKVVLQ